MVKKKPMISLKVPETYDKHAWLQRELWDELLKLLRLSKVNPQAIVDIGMGTGEHTYELSKFFPEVRVIGFDIAWGMVKYAAGREPRLSNKPFVLQSDLNEMPFKKCYFDIAISNVVYQRVPDLMRAFLDVNRILRPKGFFFLSLVTKDTLYELHRSFEEAYKKVKGPPLPAVYEHPTNSIVVNLLKKAGFSIVSVKRFGRRPTYTSTHEILKWLKATGANHHYDNWIRGIEGRKVLEEMDRIYRERYSSDGKIYATFEGLIINARKST